MELLGVGIALHGVTVDGSSETVQTRLLQQNTKVLQNAKDSCDIAAHCQWKLHSYSIALIGRSSRLVYRM